MAFSDLKADVESWAARSDFPASVYTLATAEINRRLRVRQMLSDYSASATGESVTLPTDWLQFDGLYVETGGTRIPIFPVSEFSSAAGHRSSGTPLEYTTKGSTLSLNPIPDGTYTLGGEYYAKLANFVADSDTNDVLDAFPEVYLSACLLYAFGWAQDGENEAKWGAQFSAAVSAANMANESAKYGGIIRQRGVSA